jgi:hypothetical protein
MVQIRNLSHPAVRDQADGPFSSLIWFPFSMRSASAELDERLSAVPALPQDKEALALDLAGSRYTEGRPKECVSVFEGAAVQPQEI